MPSLVQQRTQPYKIATRCFRLFISALLIGSFFVSTVPPLFAQGTVHIVQRGDSLSVIAARYGVSMGELAAANGISNNDHVWVGQQLTIPGSSGSWSGAASGATVSGATVTVGRGDSLSLIASMHGMTVQELMDLNGLTNPNHVWVGQQLQVYGNASTTTSSTSSSGATSASASSGTIYHVAQPGESLSGIAAYYGVTLRSLLDANGLWDPNNVRVGQRLAIIGGQQPTANQYYAPPAGRKRIVVDLSDQTLTAWYGDTIQLYTNISSGTLATPTITGYYKVDRKYPQQHMSGPGYSIPDVPWVMYFWEGYAFHGAYWHNNFGTPMSHGCIHLRPGEDSWLYSWAEPGTDVYINW